MSEGTIKQVQGVCTGIMEKTGGWLEFHIDIGRQYPAKLTTKQPDIIAQARAAGSGNAVWTYSEVDSGNPNPFRPGQNFINRYLSRVEAGAQLDPNLTQQAPAVQGAPAQTRDQGTNRSIERQTIVKAMVPIYPVGTPAEDAWWWNLVGKLDDFMVDGVPRPQQAPRPQAQAAAPSGYERDDTQASGGGDAFSDIPFAPMVF